MHLTILQRGRECEGCGRAPFHRKTTEQLWIEINQAIYILLCVHKKTVQNIPAALSIRL